MGGADKPGFVYMLRCADGSLYTGWTTDLRARLRAHNEGKGSKYTRSRLPVALVYAEPAADRSAALRRELEIKSLPRAQKLRLIDSGRSLPLGPQRPDQSLGT